MVAERGWDKMNIMNQRDYSWERNLKSIKIAKFATDNILLFVTLSIQVVASTWFRNKTKIWWNFLFNNHKF